MVYVYSKLLNPEKAVNTNTYQQRLELTCGWVNTYSEDLNRIAKGQGQQTRLLMTSPLCVRQRYELWVAACLRYIGRVFSFSFHSSQEPGTLFAVRHTPKSSV